MGKVISFQIPKSEKTFVQYQQDRGRYFYNNLHQHPQCQLTIIQEGSGQLLVGDYVGRFQPGDVFLLGENVPHVFRSDGVYFLEESELLVAGDTMFFDFEAFGASLYEVEDFKEILNLRNEIKGCYKLGADLAEAVKSSMRDFSVLTGLHKLHRSIQILALLEMRSDQMLSLNRIPINKLMSERDGKRMDQVIRFILENSKRHISLDEVAEQAYMSREAFCRFFKLRTRKTFTQYIQQLRISEAQKLLLESDMNISEISFEVGFQTLSHFNKTFKIITNKTPKFWRKLN
jgi:AraC-like DNA-binding protein